MTMMIRELKLSYVESNTPKIHGDVKIERSCDLHDVVRELFPEDEICHRERMVVLLLNNSNQVIGYKVIGIGGITATVADIRIILQAAILANAVNIVLAHNHPSGNLKPSTQDLRLTEALKKSAELMDIRLLDHLIITEKWYYSFNDEGHL
jgi:DNA repair protein RadC